MRTKYFKSDFKVLETITSKFFGVPFRFIYTSGRVGQTKYIASYDGEGNYVNCRKVDDSHILVGFDNHKLPCGEVFAERYFFVPDSDFPDGTFQLAGKGSIGLTLTNGSDDSDESPITSTIVMNAVRGEKGDKGDKGDAFKYEDFTPEQLASLKGESGKDGYTPQKGVDYFDGKDGYTPQKGVDYFDGNDGYTPKKGVDYFDGEDGYTPQKGVDYFDGKNGEDGKDGKDGKDGGLLYPSFKIDPHNMHLYSDTDNNRIALSKNKHFTVTF